MKDTQSTSLDERVANLPQEISPPAGVWSGIQEAIAHQTAPEVSAETPIEPLPEPVGAGFESVWAAVLSGVAAVVTFAVILVNDPSISDPVNEELPTKEPAGFATVQGFEVEGLDSAQLMKVRSDLHLSLKLALDELAPETRVTVVENLARIDKARTAIDEALRNDPANQLLEQMLLSSYTHEITLLNEFTLMARSAPQRTQL